MIIRQLSVFLENKIGMFAKIARLLGDNGINMLSFNISETQDFGIARIIVKKEEEERAFALLKANSYAVSMTPVLLMRCNHVPGAMAGILEQLSSAGISIEYLYAFADADSDFSRVVIRPDDLEKANEIVKELQ